MDRPSYKPVDRSSKLLQTILQEDLETFTTILSEARPDEVNHFVFSNSFGVKNCLNCSRGQIEYRVIMYLLFFLRLTTW